MPPTATYTPHTPRVFQKRSLEHENDYNSKKRRVLNTHVPLDGTEVIDLTADSPDEYSPTTKSKKVRTPRSSQKTEEKRKRKFRASPPKTYLEKLHRANTQRMFVISRSREENDGALEENVDIVGTTGNIYRVTITLVPRCTCPDNRKGNQCKHIVYVLVNVLKARADFRYQLAFLSTELREMFDNAPLEKQEAHADDEDSDGKRKTIEGDCPICFMEFEPETEKIVWCKTGCGQNIHKTCFEQWAATTRQNGVRCVYCRTDWPSDAGNHTLDSLMSKAQYSLDGYVNVADAVGLSGHRDYSTYHQFWVRRQFGRR